jgi:hypothetical protein
MLSAWWLYPSISVYSHQHAPSHLWFYWTFPMRFCQRPAHFSYFDFLLRKTKFMEIKLVLTQEP